MNPPIVIKQGNTLQQGSIQPTMVTVPMNSINSSMPGSIPNVMTLAKPGGQNVVVTSQNLAGTSQPTMMPNVQIVNMRPGAPGMSAQKSVATVSPRVVIGSPQVVGTRGAAPGITLQALQGLQSGQQGHLLLKTENGQYQLLRVGPAPAGSGIAAPQGQTIRLSTVPAQPGMATMSTSMAAPPQLQTMSVAQAATPVVNATVASNPTPTVTTQKPSDNTKEKCRNFLANLLDLSSKEPKSVETNVRNLIQELIDGHVEPEAFCDRLERLLNASPQPCLIGFLKKSLPLLRQSLITKELVIEGINPPSPHMAFGSVTVPAQPVILPNIQMQHIQQQQQQLQQQLHQQQQKPPGKSISVLQNIPIQAQKINLNRVASPKTAAVKLSRSQVAAPLSTVLTPGKSLLREKERDKEKRPQFSQQQFADDKMGGDDDINDVAAMGGVNLAEESQRILGSTEQIGTQIRSCKEEYLVPSMALQARIKAMMQKRGMEEPSPDVTAILNHALHERLKSVVEKLAVTAQHRIDVDIKTDPRYEVTQDVKGQLKFLEELDRVEKKKREDSEREMLLRAAKSRSKNEDPEQAKLKAKAKEMQRVELEEMRQREANHTALQAIGPRKKPRLDAPGGGDAAPGAPVGAQVNRTQLALRTRLKRICQRDFLFLMEQERETSRSHALYKFYLQ